MRTSGVLILILLSACTAEQWRVPRPVRPMPVHQESTRTLAEIQEGFDRNKGPITAIYNHVSRDRGAGLGNGKIVLSFGVAPDGSMTHCEMLSSTFKDPQFEQLFLQRVAMINFGARAVPPFEVAHYPVEFHPF